MVSFRCNHGGIEILLKVMFMKTGGCGNSAPAFAYRMNILILKPFFRCNADDTVKEKHIKL